MANESEQLQRWCGLDFALPPEDVTDDILRELLGWHLSPVLIGGLLTTSTPTQLVIQGNVLGPKHYAAALLRAKFSDVRSAQANSKLCADTIQVDSVSKGPDWSSDTDFYEPLKISNTLAEQYSGSVTWVTLPLALCLWGALLAAVTLFNWV